MDLVPLIEWLGEDGAVLAVGLVLGAAFGVFAQRSAFCTRSAVIEVARGARGDAFPVWLAGFATALLVVQYLLDDGMVHLAETRFFATPQSLSGAVVGGLLFGIGMVLARGCVSRLIVLTGSGNLRALFSIVIVAIVAWLTLFGPLARLRDAAAGLATSAALGGNDLLALAGGGQTAGMVAGALLLAAAIALGLARGASPWRLVGGMGVGLTVAAGWLATYSLSTQLFDPVPVESLSLVRPLAMTADSAIALAPAPGLDLPLFAGIVIGALLAALVSGSFRLQTFSEPGAASPARYAMGAALMGFGGVLAAGCTIGAGLTGGSVLAVTALTALAAMVLAAAVTDRVLDAGC